jgi:ketosteroid isomerase-like protein
MRIALTLLATLLLAGTSAADPIAQTRHDAPDGDAATLVAAERAFNAMAAAKNIRDAFYENMADSSILFRPGPVNGREFYRGRPANPGPVLTWYPSYAEVSNTGDLGWTTGPWEYRASKDKKAEAWGHFATVWKKQLSGKWKVVFDEGHSCAQPPQDSLEWARLGSFATNDSMVSLPRLIAGAGRLTQADAQYSQALAEKGIGEALEAWGDDAVLLLREDKPALRGAKAAGKELEHEWDGGVAAWDMHPGAISKATDLAFTWGTANLPAKGGKPAVSRKVFRVWHRVPDEGWKLALDVTNPMAPPPPPATKKP